MALVNPLCARRQYVQCRLCAMLTHLCYVKLQQKITESRSAEQLESQKGMPSMSLLLKKLERRPDPVPVIGRSVHSFAESPHNAPMPHHVTDHMIQIRWCSIAAVPHIMSS